MSPKIVIAFIAMALLLMAYEAEGGWSACEVVGGFCKPPGTCGVRGHLNAACPNGLFCCFYA